MFSIEGKIALVTGGESGIGLSCVKELLKNGLRGVTIADIDVEKSEQTLKEIAEEFGTNRAIFVRADVSIRDEFEAAFKKTIEVFDNLDIVVNNAGIGIESAWEREVSINLNGTIHGCLLAWEYLPKYRSANEGVIVNMASIAGLTSLMSAPFYTATKHAVVGLGKSLGVKQHYDRTKIRVITICPGFTNTQLLTNLHPDNYLLYFHELLKHDFKWPLQETDIVAEGIIQGITTGSNGSFWIINDSKIENIPHLPEVLESPK